MVRSQRWNEDKKTLTKQAYNVARFQTISLEEQQKMIALGCWNKKPLLPSEWVIVRMRP